MEGGRRGTLLVSYETLMALVLIGLFAYASLNYISAKANGELYFSKFYSKDLSTSAEIASAGAGNVNLRYDNLKDNLELRYSFSEGTVTVGNIGKNGVEAKNTEYYGRIKYEGMT